MAGFGNEGGFGGGGRFERKLFKTTCAACGGEAEVPFEPKKDRPVYCRNCFSQRRQ
ncbi:hypothetical protein HY642_05325 [Candidatus Woesearchaeota archaeon]|nr:hypothetical protein [Candidatus Woesearchaeota archaeon]